MHFPFVIADDIFGDDQFFTFLMLDDTASPEEFVLIDRDKAKFTEQLAELGFFGALSGIERVVRVLRVAHELLLYII